MAIYRIDAVGYVLDKKDADELAVMLHDFMLDVNVKPLTLAYTMEQMREDERQLERIIERREARAAEAREGEGVTTGEIETEGS